MGDDTQFAAQLPLFFDSFGDGLLTFDTFRPFGGWVAIPTFQLPFVTHKRHKTTATACSVTFAKIWYRTGTWSATGGAPTFQA